MLKRLRLEWSFVVILLLAFLLRIWGIHFGFPFFLHPDEIKMVEPGITMAFGFKEAILRGDFGFFDPHFFFYPSFLMYLLSIVIITLKGLFGLLDLVPFLSVSFSTLTKPTFYLVARLLSVLFGVGTVGVVYALGKRLHSREVGLLAALLLGVNFFHAENSHYYTGDVAATFFTTLAFVFLLGYLGKDWGNAGNKGRKRWQLWLSAILIGIGTATKYYPVLLLVLLMLVILTEAWPYREKVKAGFISMALTALTFFILAPFSLFNFSQFWQEMQISSQRSATGVFGYVDTNPLAYFLSQDPSFLEPYTKNSLLDGMGLVFLILSLVSLVYWGVKGNKGYRFIVLFLLLHYFFFAFHVTKILRWMLPLVPFLALLSAAFLWEMKEKYGKWGRLGVSVIIAAILIPNLYRVVLVDYAFSQKDTRVQAYVWIDENIPEGSRVVFEYFTIAQFTDRNLQFLELTHPRYNTSQEITNSRPPDYDYVRNVFRPQFIVINGEMRDRFETSGMQKIFPETSRAWQEFYDKISRDYRLAVSFSPTLYGNVRSGPEMVIYVPKD